MKSSQIKYFLNKRVKFLNKWEKVKVDDKEFEPAKESIEYYGVRADWDLKTIKEHLAET